MNSLKQLGYDFIELLLVNGTRSSRLVYFLSLIAAFLFSCIVLSSNFIGTIIPSIISAYVYYVVISKRNKDLGFNSNILFLIFTGFVIVSIINIFEITIIAAILFLIYCIVLLFKAGDLDMNEYGESPLKNPTEIKRLVWNSLFIIILLTLLSHYVNA